MGLDAVVAQDVRDQVVLGGVGLVTHATLPSLLVTSDINVIAVVDVDVEPELLATGCPTSGTSIVGAMTRSEVLPGVESTRREVHDRPRHEEGVWEEAVVKRWEVRRVEKKRRGRPNRGRTERLLFHLHR